MESKENGQTAEIDHLIDEGVVFVFEKMNDTASFVQLRRLTKSELTLPQVVLEFAAERSNGRQTGAIQTSAHRLIIIKTHTHTVPVIASLVCRPISSLFATLPDAGLDRTKPNKFDNGHTIRSGQN